MERAVEWTVAVTHQELLGATIDLVAHYRDVMARRRFRLVSVEWRRGFGDTGAVFLRFEGGNEVKLGSCGHPMIRVKGYSDAEGKPDDLCWYCWKKLKLSGRMEQNEQRPRKRKKRRRPAGAAG